MKKFSTGLVLTFISLCNFLSLITYGQAGNLDPTFGYQGIVRTDFGSPINTYGNQGRQVLAHPDGSFYVVFEIAEQTVVAHHFADGALDVAYGKNGYSVPAYIRDAKAVLQPDGKIVAGGYQLINNTQDFVLARFNTDGSADLSFSGDGLQTTDFFGRGDDIRALALQSDGKIVAAGIASLPGNNDFAVARYNPDGSLDNSFSGDGKATIDFSGGDAASALAIQNDGKIVVAGGGGLNILVARLLPDGTPDNSFSGDGKETIGMGGHFTNVRAVALQSDQKIVIAGTISPFGNQNFLVLRLHTDGTPDNSFTGDGIQETDLGSMSDAAEAMVIQPDGKIVVGGLTSAGGFPGYGLARYNADGALDHAFSDDGIAITAGVDFLFSLALQADTKLLAAGWSSIGGIPHYSVFRFLQNGSLDNSFDIDGKLTGYLPGGITQYWASALQPDGKIVTAGYIQRVTSRDFAIARYNADGSLDNSFSGDGKAEVGLNGVMAWTVAVQPDGKIVAAGSGFGSFVLARLNADGSPDNSFSGDGIVVAGPGGSGGELRALAIQPDGKLVVAGYTNLSGNSDFVVMRFNADGSPDNSFSDDGMQFTDFGLSQDVATGMIIQPDGKIIVAGGYALNGVFDFAVARYNTDGSPDLSFDGDGKLRTDFAGSRDFASAAALQPDGKIVVVGNLTNFNGNELAMARYHPDGTLDNSFSGDGKFVFNGVFTTENLTSVVIQADGKIIVGGHSHGGNNNDLLLARINPDGTLDPSFSGDGKFIMDLGYGEDIIYGMTLGSDRVYAAGRTRYGPTVGLLAAFLINDCSINVSIPDAVTLPAGVNANTVYIGYAPASDLTLTAQPSGGTGPISYLWSTGATTQSITVTPAAPATYTVTVTDAVGCSKSVSKQVNVVDVRCGNKLDKVLICKVPPGNPANAHTQCVSANAVAAHLNTGSYLGNCNMASMITRGEAYEETTEVFGITATPNPSRSVFRITVSGKAKMQAELIVRDAGGRIVERKLVWLNSTVTLGADYRPGIYLVELRQGSKKAVTKLIKQ